jgi:hypothetical protein
MHIPTPIHTYICILSHTHAYVYIPTNPYKNTYIHIHAQNAAPLTLDTVNVASLSSYGGYGKVNATISGSDSDVIEGLPSSHVASGDATACFSCRNVQESVLKMRDEAAKNVSDVYVCMCVHVCVCVCACVCACVLKKREEAVKNVSDVYVCMCVYVSVYVCACVCACVLKMRDEAVKNVSGVYV